MNPALKDRIQIGFPLDKGEQYIRVRALANSRIPYIVNVKNSYGERLRIDSGCERAFQLNEADMLTQKGAMCCFSWEGADIPEGTDPSQIGDLGQSDGLSGALAFANQEGFAFSEQKPLLLCSCAITNPLSSGYNGMTLAPVSIRGIDKWEPFNRYSLFSKWEAALSAAKRFSKAALLLHEEDAQILENELAGRGERIMSQPISALEEWQSSPIPLVLRIGADELPKLAEILGMPPIFGSPVHSHQRLLDMIAGGRVIPFVGTALFRGGPLGCRSLSHAIQPEEPSSPGDCTMASVSEFAERHRGGRESFLAYLTNVLQNQKKEVSESDVDALLEIIKLSVRRAIDDPAIKKPPIIVSTNWDLLIEEALEEFKPVIITHVIRSYDRQADEKIVVLRPDELPEICLADEFNLRDAQCVIYKPLGSPLLHDRLDDEHVGDMEIDTVVATESDYLALLGRMQKQKTGIPPVLIRPLQRQPIIFFGYGMDTWHYRLLAQVLHAAGRQHDKQNTLLAVRERVGSFEQLSWNKLSAEVVNIDYSKLLRDLTDHRPFAHD